MKTKHAIIESATAVFGKYGLYGAKMTEIAEKADVNKALVYYHFKTRENLYRIVLGTNLKHMINDLHYNLFLKHVSKPKEDQIIRIFIHYWEEQTEVLHLLTMEIHQGGDLLFDLLRDSKTSETYDKLYNITTLLEEHVHLGSEDAQQVIQRFISFIGIIIIYFLLEPIFARILGMREDERSEFLEQRIQFIKHLYQAHKKTLAGNNFPATRGVNNEHAED